MTEHVKIYGIKPRIQYVADGTSISYEFPFAIFKTTDIEVYFGDIKQDTSIYTVSEARHSDGGTVTFESAPESGTIITIIRNLSIERTSDFQEGSTLRAKVLNDELDYQIACTQQIAENLNRSMVLPPYATDNDVDLTLPVPSAGKAIVWNSDGTNLENSTVEVNALESTLRGYKTTAETAATTATKKAEIASDKADIATTKAQIATDKAAEATATLANKANKDMDNLSATGKKTIANLAMPSDTYEDLTFIVNTFYTAPADGYVVIDKLAGSSGRYLFCASYPSDYTGEGGNVSAALQTFSMYKTTNDDVLSGFICVKKGDKFEFRSNTNGNIRLCRFVYAEGEIQ